MDIDPPPFSVQDKVFLKQIGNDIITRPNFYRPGIEYLSQRFSADALHAADTEQWERERDCPTQIASTKVMARDAAVEFAWAEIEPRGLTPGERAEFRTKNAPPIKKRVAQIQRRTLKQVSAPPDKSREYRLSNCLIEAFSTLLKEGLETPDDDLNPHDLMKAKAVLCLTWLLTDKEANRHPFAVGFGEWGADSTEELAIKGRAIARCETLDSPEHRNVWMELAKMARQVLSQPEDGPSACMNTGAGAVHSTNEGGTHTEEEPAEGTKLQDHRLQDAHIHALDALISLNAIDRETRKNLNEIADAIEGRGGNSEKFKRYLADLVHWGLAGSKQGAGGGTWVTEQGRAALKAHKEPPK